MLHFHVSSSRLRSAGKKVCVSPGNAVLYGAIAGCAGTAVITILGRIAAAIKHASEHAHERSRTLPKDPFNKKEVIAWQDRARSPAAYAPRGNGGSSASGVAVERAASVTPAGALAEAKGPGPEGAAEEFVVKLGSGLFDRDWAPYTEIAGKILHFVYGSFGGIVYGILQGKKRRDVWLAGSIHGAGVWGFGPGSLVPAMRLMLPPWEAPKLQTVLMIAGHLVYGVTVAKVFDVQLRRQR